jgi:hypothetical protein
MLSDHPPLNPLPSREGKICGDLIYYLLFICVEGLITVQASLVLPQITNNY